LVGRFSHRKLKVLLRVKINFFHSQNEYTKSIAHVYFIIGFFYEIFHAF